MTRTPTTLLMLLLTGCQGAMTPEASSAAIIGGAADYQDPAVLEIVLGNGQTFMTCTGVLVSPHVLLTAAHCTDPASPDIKGLGSGTFTYQVYSGTYVGIPPSVGAIAVVNYYWNNLYDVNNSAGGHDIGAIVLKDALPVPPLPFNRAPLDASMKGRSVRQIGYGRSVAGDAYSSGTKRVTSSVLVDYNDVQAMFAYPGQQQCFGDSGGPSLLEMNGVETIVGLDSWGVDGACTQGTWNTRTDVEATSFIDHVIAAADPGYTPPTGGGSTRPPAMPPADMVPPAPPQMNSAPPSPTESGKPEAPSAAAPIGGCSLGDRAGVDAPAWLSLLLLSILMLGARARVVACVLARSRARSLSDTCALHRARPPSHS